MPFRFRPPVPDDAAMLLRWRTDPVITRFMFTDLSDPDEGRQRAWLEAMEGRRDFRHFVIENDGRPVGYLSYSDIDWESRRCSSGSFMAEDADRRRLAGLLHPFIMDYCFYGMQLNKMVNYFMAGNDKVIAIQRRLKCREVGVLRQHVFKYGRYHDVHVFELLKEDWETHVRAFPKAATLAAFGVTGTP